MTRFWQRVMEDMEIRTFSSNTIDSYVFRVARVAKHFGKSLNVLGSKEIRQYQIYLCRERKLALAFSPPYSLHALHGLHGEIGAGQKREAERHHEEHEGLEVSFSPRAARCSWPSRSHTPQVPPSRLRAFA